MPDIYTTAFIVLLLVCGYFAGFLYEWVAAEVWLYRMKKKCATSTNSTQDKDSFLYPTNSQY